MSILQPQPEAREHDKTCTAETSGSCSRTACSCGGGNCSLDVVACLATESVAAGALIESELLTCC